MSTEAAVRISIDQIERDSREAFVKARDYFYAYRILEFQHAAELVDRADGQVCLVVAALFRRSGSWASVTWGGERGGVS
jgi:hypothetical protein